MDGGGPWLRSANREFLYAFGRANDGYSLLVTDMSSVFEERLSAKQLEDRGEQLACPFALDSEHQRRAFGDMLADLLGTEAAVFNVRVDSTVLIRASDAVNFYWQFNMHRLTPEDCARVFAALAASLFGVIGNLGTHISHLNEEIADNNAIVRGLEDANKRQIHYSVPKTLEPVYKAALSTSGTATVPTDVVDIAASYWPASEVAVVEPADAVETDSDATHESSASDSSEHIWATSFRSTQQP